MLSRKAKTGPARQGWSFSSARHYRNQDELSPSPTYAGGGITPRQGTVAPGMPEPARFVVPVTQRPGYQEPLPGAMLGPVAVTGPQRKTAGRLQPIPPYDGYEAIVSHSMTRPILNMYETTPFDQTFVTSRVPQGGWYKGQFTRQFALTFRPPMPAVEYDPLNGAVTYRANF